MSPVYPLFRLRLDDSYEAEPNFTRLSQDNGSIFAT